MNKVLEPEDFLPPCNPSSYPVSPGLPWATSPLGNNDFWVIYQGNQRRRINQDTFNTKIKEDLLDPNQGTKLISFGNRSLDSKLNDIVSLADYGLHGDGENDDTDNITKAFQDAQGKILLMEPNKVYLIDPNKVIKILPGTTVITSGSKFKIKQSSTVYGIEVHDYVTIDRLEVDYELNSTSAPTTRGIHIFGNQTNIGNIIVYSNIEGTGASFNVRVAVKIGFDEPNYISGLRIGGISVKNWDRPITIQNTKLSLFENIECEKYLRTLYLKDVNHIYVSGGYCHKISKNSNGGPGENGILIESVRESNSTNNVRIENFTSEDSGEHGYRLGGTKSISDIWFYNCKSLRSGSSITVRNPSATEWHGGCGFKILGGTTKLGEKHRNIYFDNCVVEDCNYTPGSFPVGHGNGNYAGFQIAVVDNVHMNNCTVTTKDQEVSAGYGVEIMAASNVYIDNCNILKCNTYGIRIYEAASSSSYPGWKLPCENIVISGGVIESRLTAPIYIGINEYDHKGIRSNGVTLRGGEYAIRILVPTTGSYRDFYFDCTYEEPRTNPSTTNSHYVYGTANAVLNIRAPWVPNSSSFPQGAPGSVWQDTLGGAFWFRRPDRWSSMIFEDLINRQSNSGNLGSLTSVINTTRKITGMLVFSSSNSKLYRASGPDPSSIWHAVDGSGTITPT